MLAIALVTSLAPYATVRVHRASTRSLIADSEMPYVLSRNWLMSGLVRSKLASHGGVFLVTLESDKDFIFFDYNLIYAELYPSNQG